MKSDITDNYKLTAYKQRETYISTINHDLKIPALAQIRALELLAGESLGKLNSKQKEIIDLTLDSCRTMYDMLTSIIYSYKYENQEIVPDLEYFDAIELVCTSFSKFYADFMKNNIDAQLINNKHEVIICADKEQFKKAIDNIFAYCFSCAHCEGSLICEILNDSKFLFIQILFRNPFLKNHNFTNMFNKYTTSNEKLDKIGTNLRLQLAKQIIMANKGDLLIETKQKMFQCVIKMPI